MSRHENYCWWPIHLEKMWNGRNWYPYWLIRGWNYETWWCLTEHLCCNLQTSIEKYRIKLLNESGTPKFEESFEFCRGLAKMSRQFYMKISDRWMHIVLFQFLWHVIFSHTFFSLTNTKGRTRFVVFRGNGRLKCSPCSDEKRHYSTKSWESLVSLNAATCH